MIIKVSLVLVFILLRAHEHEALLMFCIFQNKLRVHDLQVHKDSFHRIERQLNRIFIWAAAIIIPIPFVYYFAMRYSNFEVFFYKVGTSFWMTGIFLATFIVYNSSTLALIYQMYSNHRLAFMKHKRTLVVLFITTEITFLVILAF